MKSQLFGAVSAVLFTFTTLSAHAAFSGRLETSFDSGGNWFQAYYDDQLDVTWAANANINGRDTWDNQVAWAAGLTIDGIGGWRLPNMDINGDGTIVDCSSGTQAACMDNEYGHLFHYGAGTTLGANIQGGLFSNVQSHLYWSGTEFASRPDDVAWFFNFFITGGQNAGVKLRGDIFAWAVHSGDVSAIPVPAAVWLFGSGLLGLLGLARRKR